jgi:hypothetical protein
MSTTAAEPNVSPKRVRRSRFAGDAKSNLDAKFDAQKLAFGPLMFQAARVLRNTGALQCIKASGRIGITAEKLEADLKDVTEAVVTLCNATVFATITRFAVDIDSHRIRCRQKARAGPHEHH